VAGSGKAYPTVRRDGRTHGRTHYAILAHREHSRLIELRRCFYLTKLDFVVVLVALKQRLDVFPETLP
jgi:hypothetical protein